LVIILNDVAALLYAF